MPYGFFTVERWTRRGKRTSLRAPGRWIPAKHLDARNKLSSAIEWIEAQRRPRFYRITQTQRMVWAEEADGHLRLHRWRAGSFSALERTAKTLERNQRKQTSPARSAGK
jgi:hypothetical protein